MSTRGYRLSRRAIRDLDDIVRYIAAHDTRAAGRVLDKLLESMQLLADHPHLGMVRDDLHTGLRLFVPDRPANRYAVFYYTGTDKIEISDVIHSSRDWLGMFHCGER